MARTARIKKSNSGTVRYHLMSRTNDRRFLFEKGRVKTQLVDALKRAAAFSGVELEAYVAMDNHFHIVCKVVRCEDKLPEGELIRRVAALKGEQAAEDLASHWEELRGIVAFACTAASLSTQKHGGISSVPEEADVLSVLNA